MSAVTDATDYRSFISSKRRAIPSYGFDPHAINDRLFQWQADITRWAIKRGRAALFEGCGLGKTAQQLEWASQICQHTGGNVIVHCPVGVRHQTAREATKFGIPTPVAVVDDKRDVKPGISLVNYEKLHHFDPADFIGVVLDESGILKAFTGVTKRQLCEAYRNTQYRLACTATPAPNDFLELGNHAEFLGVMPSNEMISRWFINDTMRAGGYRLKGHAADDFWRWMSTWSVCISAPSDLGYDDDGFVLPPLIEHRHIVEPDEREPDSGFLFRVEKVNATSMHADKRHSAMLRARKAAGLIAARHNEIWLVWCDTNYEADELVAAIPNAVDVRGNDSEQKKESFLLSFANGEIPVLISKPSIAGFGMNFQVCHNVIFVGLSYSFESYYQAVRRTWRFGQTHPVDVHVISTPAEEAMRRAVEAKQAQFTQMRIGMAKAVRSFTMDQIYHERTRDKYEPMQRLRIPRWLRQGA